MKKHTIGGQAVVEGVMLRSRNHVAVAVRKPNGRITVKTDKYRSWTQKNRFLNFPVIRGIIILIETIILGMKTLNYSANESLDEKDEKLSSKEIGLTLFIGVALALLIFKFLPLFLASKLAKGNIFFNITDGLIKLGIFLLYIYVISRMKDVRRIFEYHGAEHAVVNCYESGKKVNVKNVQKFSTAQSRCGTTFLFFVVFISVIFYIFIPYYYSLWQKLLLRLLLLPLIAGVAYELIRLSPKYGKNILMRIIIAPGMLLQKLTTKTPDKKQIEVAIKALESVLKKEKG